MHPLAVIGRGFLVAGCKNEEKNILVMEDWIYSSFLEFWQGAEMGTIYSIFCLTPFLKFIPDFLFSLGASMHWIEAPMLPKRNKDLAFPA